MSPKIRETRTIKPLNKAIKVKLHIPGSKSISHRVLICSAMADGISQISNLSLCDDVIFTMDGLKELGVKIKQKSGTYEIHGTKGKFPNTPSNIFMGNSGTSYRFFMSLLSLLSKPIRLNGDIQMNKRPIEDLTIILRKGGVNIKYLAQSGFPPVEITGPFQGGDFQIPGEKSSQFFSSLCLIAPYLPKTTHLKSIGKLHSLPYIELTTHIMQEFGIIMTSEITNKKIEVKIPHNQLYSSQNLIVEGDYSNAAFFLVATAIIGGKISLSGLNPNSLQGDKIIVSFLKEMGCKINQTEDQLILTRENTFKLKPLQVDLGNYPDLVMPLSIAALFAQGSSEFRNIGHLIYKESNRLEIMQKNLNALGADVIIKDDKLKIIPRSKYHGILLDPANDHRIAMSFAIAGLKIPEITILNSNCVQKSFPDFFNAIKKLY